MYNKIITILKLWVSVVICSLTFSACTPTITQEHIDIAVDKCKHFGGLKQLEVVQNNEFIGNMYCTDGTMIGGFRLRREK